MFFRYLGFERDTSGHKLYLFQDTTGLKYNFYSNQIKRMWGEHQFEGVKLDKRGRLIEDRLSSSNHNTERSLLKTHSGYIFKGVRVLDGVSLVEYAKEVTVNFRKRFAVDEILYRLKTVKPGKVIPVKGIRRTGKTTAICHTILELVSQGVDPALIGFLSISITTKPIPADKISKFIETTEWKYVFIDEVTHAEDIVYELASIANFLAVGRKVVLTGTDSYVWPLAVRNALHDRTYPVDLTYMSLKEYCTVFPERVKGLSKERLLEEFGRYGGVLNKSEYSSIKNAYISLQTALVGNILNTLHRNKANLDVQEVAGALFTVTKDQLTEAILISILEACKTQKEDYLNTVRVSIPAIAAEIVGRGNYKSVGVKKDIITQTTKALIDLNILCVVPNIVSMVGFRLPEGIIKNSKIEYVCHVNSLYNTVTGYVNREKWGENSFENLIISQCVQFADSVGEDLRGVERREYTVGYCRYTIDKTIYHEENETPEVDIVITSTDLRGYNKLVTLIEVKEGREPKTRLAKNLVLGSMRDVIGSEYKKVVVYNGTTQKIRDIHYVNAVDFLLDISKWV